MRDPQGSFTETAVTTASVGVTATHAAVTNKQYAITHVAAVSDAASTLQIKGGAAGTTVLWQLKLQANVPFSVMFCDPILGVSGQAVSAALASSTSAASVNINGFEISKV